MSPRQECAVAATVDACRGFLRHVDAGHPDQRTDVGPGEEQRDSTHIGHAKWP